MLMKLRAKYRRAPIDGGGKPKRLKGGATSKSDNGTPKKRTIWYYLERNYRKRMGGK